VRQKILLKVELNNNSSVCLAQKSRENVKNSFSLSKKQLLQSNFLLKTSLSILIQEKNGLNALYQSKIKEWSVAHVGHLAQQVTYQIDFVFNQTVQRELSFLLKISCNVTR
jgi:hypothetical protein